MTRLKIYEVSNWWRTTEIKSRMFFTRTLAEKVRERYLKKLCGDNGYYKIFGDSIHVFKINSSGYPQITHKIEIQ